MPVQRFYHVAVLGMAAVVLALVWSIPASSSDTEARPEGDGSVQSRERSLVSTDVPDGDLTLAMLTYSSSDGACLDLLATRLSDDAPVFRMGGCGLNNDATLTLAEVRDSVRAGTSPPLAIQGTQVLDGRTVALAFGIAPAGAQVRLTLADGLESTVSADSAGYFIASVLTDSAETSIKSLSVAGQWMPVG